MELLLSIFSEEELSDIAAAALERGVSPTSVIHSAVMNDLFR